MKSEIISTKGLKREVKVVVPVSVIKKASDKLYQDLKNKVSVKGFRKGKYPKSLLQKRFAEEIQQEIKQKVVPEYLTKALQEHKLRAVTQPQVDAKEVIKDKPYEFTASFEVFPEFQIPDFKQKAQLKTADIKISPQEIKNYVNLVSLQNSQYKETKGVVKDKNQVNIQLFFQKIENKKEDRKVHIFYYVGSNEISEDLDKALIGMKKGEKKELTLQVSPHTLSKDIAGKKIQVEVMLLATAEPLSVVKNEKFYQKINPALKSESDLIKFSENSLKAMREKEIEIQEQTDLRSQLINFMDFEVPEESLKNKIEAIKYQKTQKDKNENAPEDKKSVLTEEDAQKTKQEALDSLRYQFFMAKMIEDKKIKVSPEEMDEGIRQLAKSYGIDPIQITQNEYGKRLVDMLRNQLEENQILNLIRKEVKRV